MLKSAVSAVPRPATPPRTNRLRALALWAAVLSGASNLVAGDTDLGMQASEAGTLGSAAAEVTATAIAPADSDSPSAEPVSSTTVRLRPYSARYSTTAMGMAMTLKRSLSVTDDGRYTLHNRGEAMLARIEETAHFTLEHGRIRGEDFSYHLKSLVSRQREVQFLPEQSIIRSLRKKQWTEHPWRPEILDRLSQQEQLRLELMAASTPPVELTFTIVDGPKVSDKVMVLVGEERLATPMGELSTLHYRQVREKAGKRASDIWVAPDLEYAMVRTLHVEDGTEIDITLEALTFDGAD